MTNENQIIALAKLDGWIEFNNKFQKTHTNGNHSLCYEDSLPNYITSRDAIWPLIQGLSQSEFGVFIDTLSGVTYEMAAIVAIIKATIPQLAYGVLKAKGLWVD